jgi:hypothetical protein
MKLLSLIFVGLLSWAQVVGGAELADKPLSMFRDGDCGAVGYALFALLLAIGALMAAALNRVGRRGEAGVFVLAVVLLFVVLATPSLDSALHETGAAALLCLLFGYYAIQLVLAQSNWLYFHLCLPIALAPLLGLGYGPWQKGLIVYLVLVINIHWQLLPAIHSRPARARRRTPSLRRHVVYVVEPGRLWERRKRLDGTSCAM